ISKPGEDKAEKYKTQLQAYKYAFENSATLKPIKISRMGLLIFYPDLAKFEAGKASLEFPPTWLEVEPDDESFIKTIGEIDSLLSGSLPEYGESCQWCKYRNVMSAKTDLVTSDLPF